MCVLWVFEYVIPEQKKNNQKKKKVIVHQNCFGFKANKIIFEMNKHENGINLICSKTMNYKSVI